MNEGATFPYRICQKPVLRQIAWRVQNGPMTEKGL